MFKIIYCFFLLLGIMQARGNARVIENPDFTLGNVSFFSMDLGETFQFHNTEMEFLRLDHHFARLRIAEDTFWIKVARRSPAFNYGPIQVFVADNKHVKTISGNSPVHGLLKKEVLVAVSKGDQPLMDPVQFGFPVSFTQGFMWRTLEDTYMFSYQPGTRAGKDKERSYGGVGIDLRESRAMEKHMILAMESGRVMWTESALQGTGDPQVAVCIQSESSPQIFYIYEHLHNKSLMVKKGQRILKGEGIGYGWGEGAWNYLRVGAVYSDTIPGFNHRHCNSVNIFPLLLDLYFGRQPVFSHAFTKGQIYLGRSEHLNGNSKNVSAFEEYHGTGWILGRWNTADKVEWVSSRRSGNARLRKVLFRGEPAQCVNPNDWYDFEINVRNGTYRIRALVGDHQLPSWQKIEFEGVAVGTFKRDAGVLDWTNERIVKVHDGKLTVRIYVDDEHVAGISEIVFQQAQL